MLGLLLYFSLSQSTALDGTLFSFVLAAAPPHALRTAPSSLSISHPIQAQFSYSPPFPLSHTIARSPNGAMIPPCRRSQLAKLPSHFEFQTQDVSIKYSLKSTSTYTPGQSPTQSASPSQTIRSSSAAPQTLAQDTCASAH